MNGRHCLDIISGPATLYADELVHVSVEHEQISRAQVSHDLPLSHTHAHPHIHAHIHTLMNAHILSLSRSLSLSHRHTIIQHVRHINYASIQII